MKITNVTNNYKVYLQAGRVISSPFNNNQISFQGYISDLFFSKKDFIPKVSIINNKDGYIGEVGTHFRNLSVKEKIKESKRLYSLLKTSKEKEAFKHYFGEYLIEEQSQPIINKPVTTPTKQQSVQKTLTTIYTKETILQEFEAMEKEEIPAFVTKIANGTREEQYDLLEIYQELSQKHDDLMKNDPSVLYKKEIREQYYEQLKKDVESEFIASGKKYNSTNVVVEAGKRLEQIAKDAGMNDYAPEVKNLGRKLYVLEKQMEEQNISFVPRIPKVFNSNEEKWKYVSNAIKQIPKNTSSAMEALAVFEKYGEKRFIDDNTSLTSLEVLGTKVSNYIDEILSKGKFNGIYHSKESIELTNNLLQRFLQVHSKYATNMVDSRSYPDVHSVIFSLKRFASVENKDTMLMMINSVKDLAVDKEEYTSLKYFFKHFRPEDSEVIKENDMPDIEKAIEELGEKVKNLPDEHKNIK